MFSNEPVVFFSPLGANRLPVAGRGGFLWDARPAPRIITPSISDRKAFLHIHSNTL